MNHQPLNVLIIGAHPDDADFSAGGTAALYARQGHRVKLVSLTNGDAGHHAMGGAPLAWRRRAEAAASGRVLGVEYITLDIHDGALLPTLENRNQIIALIRTFQPDLIMIHRPNDYHPDHRYASQLVQDASYMVTVPNVVSQVPHLATMPVIVYLWDTFQKPYPFQADVVVAIDGRGSGAHPGTNSRRVSAPGFAENLCRARLLLCEPGACYRGNGRGPC